MKDSMPKDRMPEAEVALRLAFFLLSLPDCEGFADVAIDGAQVRVHGAQVFPIIPFLREEGWEQVKQKGKNPWQGLYQKSDHRLRIHARSGEGDVVVKVGPRRIRTECKGGPRVKKPGSPEYRILRAALGQAITIEKKEENDVLVVAVPHTDSFAKLARRWRSRPLIVQSGIQIVLVGRDGTVEGLHL